MALLLATRRAAGAGFAGARGARVAGSAPLSSLLSAGRGAVGTVEVRFADGHRSAFHPVWLVDHDPAATHPTSLQRQLDSAALDPATGSPAEVEVAAGGAQLVVRWPHAPAGSWGAAREVRLDAAWLRRHCYDDAARAERKAREALQRRPWNAAEMPKRALERVGAREVAESDAALVRLLDALVREGVAIVTGMPQTGEGTERIVRRIGPPRETFYGAMWDTAPKAAEEVNDTAYTKDALHPHTDSCYLWDSPGLQLFNCVAQSGSGLALNDEGEVEGATKLVDGFKVLEDLKQRDPEAFRFFATTPLKWQQIQKGVFVRAFEPVVQFDPDGSGAVRQLRYNPYDLAPLDYLRPHQIADYYRHTKTLNSMLRSKEYISYCKMDVGEMVIVDNHRVLHGRTKFTGFRNMVGCYMGRDDWLSTLRSLKGITSVLND
jgi:trimethyllysine dioxygenase